MARKPLLIFDFDGTLADTFALFTDAFNTAAARYRLTHVGPELLKELQDMPPKDVLRRLRISLWKLPFVGLLVQRIMRKERQGIELFKGIEELVTALHKERVALGILSSNRVDTISQVMEAAGLIKYFMFIRSTPNHLRKDRALRSIQKRFPEYELWYVGDQESDVRAAQRAGIKSIGVGWGFNTLRMVKTAAPTHAVKKPREIAELFSSNR